MRQQQGIRIRALHWPRLQTGIIRPDRDDVAVALAAAERHQHPVTWYDLHRLRDRVRIDLAEPRAAGGFDSHLGVERQAAFMAPGRRRAGRVERLSASR